MKKLFSIIIAGLMMLPLLASSAYARDNHRRHEEHFRAPVRYDRHWQYNHWVYVPVYYAPPPVVYYYYPQPVYYSPSTISWYVR